MVTLAQFLWDFLYLKGNICLFHYTNCSIVKYYKAIGLFLNRKKNDNSGTAPLAYLRFLAKNVASATKIGDVMQ